MIKNFDEIFTFILKIAPICLFFIQLIKNAFEYCYAKKCEAYFNIPYKYFLFDWKESLMESIKFSFLLMLILSTNIFIFLYRCEYTMLMPLSISFALFNTLYILCTFSIIIKNNETIVIRIGLIILLISKLNEGQKCKLCAA